MRHRSLVSLVIAFVLVAGAARADLVKFKDWDKSPEYTYLATDADKKAWKDVKTDEEAEKFVALFWARRNPDLKNPANAFKQMFDARVAKSDEIFPLGKKRGALTERGKLLILIGAPKTMAQKVDSSADTPFGSVSDRTTGGGFLGTGGGTTITYQFLYEKPQLPPWADVQSLDAKFQVDSAAVTEHLIDMATVKRLETKAVQMALVHPDLTQAPVYKTRDQAEAEAKAAAEATAEVTRGATLTPSVREALEAAMTKDTPNLLAVWPLSAGESSGQLMLQILVPAATVPAAEGTKLALLIKSKDGKDAARREEPANLQKSKGDFFCDRSLLLAPGDYDVAAALLDGTGAVLASAHRATTIPSFPAEFSISPLILSVNDFPAENGKPGDAFLFAQRKFVVKGDGVVGPNDGLSYFVRVYNPSFDPATKKSGLKQKVKIKAKAGGPAQELAPPPDSQVSAPADAKEGKAAVDIGYGVIEANAGQYFRGDQIMTVTITDTIANPNKSVEIVVPFKVLAPPPAAHAAPAPKKKG